MQSFRVLRSRILQGAGALVIALAFVVYAWGVDPAELFYYLIVSLMLVLVLILPAAVVAGFITWWRGRRS